MKPLCQTLAVSTVLMLAAAAPVPSLQPMQGETHALRIDLQTDVLTSVPNNKVKLTQGAVTKTFLTDAGAASPWTPIRPDAAFTITLKQKNTSEGLAVGQVRTHVVASLGVDHAVYDLLTVFQPLLQPVVLDSSIDHVIGLGTRWGFEALDGSAFQFPASVGVLLTPREIDAFRDYYGIQLLKSDYRLGLIVNVEDAESLAGGMALEMDLDTYGFSELPLVDSYHVALSASHLGTAQFDVAPALWNPIEIPNLGYYFWTGTLGKGMNVLLFGSATGGGFSEQLASLPSFPPVVAGTGDRFPLTGGIKDCIPAASAPAEGLMCTDAGHACEDSSECPPSGCTGITAADCTSVKVPVGEPFCGTADSTGAPSKDTRTWTTTFTGGVNFTITIGGEEVGGSVEAGGSAGASTSESHTLELTVGNGDNTCNGSPAGECAQAFQTITKCRKTCTLHKRKFTWFLGGRYYCGDEPCTLACIKNNGNSVEHCNRTCGS